MRRRAASSRRRAARVPPSPSRARLHAPSAPSARCRSWRAARRARRASPEPIVQLAHRRHCTARRALSQLQLTWAARPGASLPSRGFTRRPAAPIKFLAPQAQRRHNLRWARVSCVSLANIKMSRARHSASSVPSTPGARKVARRQLHAELGRWAAALAWQTLLSANHVYAPAS